MKHKDLGPRPLPARELERELLGRPDRRADPEKPLTCWLLLRKDSPLPSDCQMPSDPCTCRDKKGLGWCRLLWAFNFQQELVIFKVIGGFFRSAYSHGATKTNIQVSVISWSWRVQWFVCHYNRFLHFSHLFLYLDKATFKARPLQKLVYLKTKQNISLTLMLKFFLHRSALVILPNDRCSD